MSTGGPLDFYNYPYTNSFVNPYPQVKFADPLIPEFRSLFPKNQLNKGEYFTWFLLYYNESDLFSLAFPSKNVVDFLNLKGFSVSIILSVESQFGMHEAFRCCRNVEKTEFLYRFDRWKTTGKYY